MERIHMLAGIARRRLYLQAWLDASLPAAAVAAALLLAAILERRLFGWSSSLGIPTSGWGWLLLAVAGLAALAAAVGFVRARPYLPSAAQAALELDARIGSSERLATALALSGTPAAEGDAFARAAIADAVSYAGDRDLPGRAREAFPVRATGRWWVAPAIAAACVATWAWLPQREAAQPRTPDATAVAAARVPSAEEKRLEELVKEIERTPELAARLDAEIDSAKRTLDESGRGPVRSPEDAARESARRMAELEQRLAEVSDSREARASRELRDSLAMLDLPKDQGAARDLAEALKRGDFEAAKKAVEDLRKAAAGSELSKEDRDRLAKALEDTARQLDSLAKDPSKLAEALRNAGMDPALANNPAALQQAIAQSKDLNASQKEAIQRMAQSVQDSQSRMGQMSQQMNQMASQCKNPGQQGQEGQQGGQSGQGSQGKEGQEGQGSQSQQGQDSKDGMSGMLDQAEADRQMSMAAESAASQCQGGMSESEADSALAASAESDRAGQGEGSGRKQGQGGGHGQALGGDRSMRETAFGTKLQKQKGPRQDGDVIARQLVAGQSPVGESRVALEEVAGAIAPGYERGTEDDPVPAHLRDVHKRYFGNLRRKFEDRGIAPAKPAPPTAAAPAGASAPGTAGGR